jgi:hypothetical protein
MGMENLNNEIAQLRAFIDTGESITILSPAAAIMLHKQRNTSERARIYINSFRDEQGPKSTKRVLDKAIYNKEQKQVAEIRMFIIDTNKAY